MADVQNTNVFLKQLPNGYTQVLPTGSYRTDGLAYVIQPGTKTDVALLGSGSYGKIYLPGDLKEYTRTVVGSTIRLTRTVGGKLEEIITNANAPTPQGHTLQFGDRALNLTELKSYTNDPTFRVNLDRSFDGWQPLGTDWEWVWNQYTNLGEHGVIKNKVTGEQYLTKPSPQGDKESIQKQAESLVYILNAPELADRAKTEFIAIPWVDKNGQSINSSVPIPVEFLPDLSDPSYIQNLTKEAGIYRLQGQLASVVDPNSSGGAWSDKPGKSSGPGFGPMGFLAVMAENLYNQTGLTDLNKLGVKDLGEEGVEYFNKDSGKKVNFNGTLGGYGEGFGWTSTSLDFKDGKPVLKTTGQDTSDLGTIMPIISLALLAFPGVGQAVGSLLVPAGTSAAVTAAVGSAVVNAGIQIASGVPVEDALKTAAITLAVPSVIPDLTSSAVLNNAIRSAATSIALGADPEKAILSSVMSAAATSIGSKLSLTGQKGVDQAIANALGSVVKNVALGQDITEALTQGAINAAVAAGVESLGAGQNLTKDEKSVLTVAANAIVNAARTGQFNPLQIAGQLSAIGLSKADAAKTVAAEAANLPKSNTAIGAIAVDNSGELFVMDDDGNRMMLSGVAAGRVYTPDEWVSIKGALNAGQAQYVNSLISAMNKGVMTPEEVAEDLHESGYSDDTTAKIFSANEQYIYRANQAQKIAQDYSAVGSDIDRDNAINQLKVLGYSAGEATGFIDNIDRQVAARNDYANVARDYINGAATESQLQSAMDAAGIKGDLANQQLLYYRAIKAGDELTSSEATQAAVAGLRSWNVIDRKGTQVSWDLNDDGTPYVKAARDASGKDITDLFYGSSPQAVQKYAIEDQQRYVDRFQKQLTTTAEKYFAPGSKVTPDQAVAMLKQTDGMTDAMAKDLVVRWDQQKEAIAKNSISIDPNTNKTSRILTPEEFERVLSKANVDISGDKFNQRYQAYLYVNGELLRTGNANDGFVLPGEVLEVVNKGKNITQLPTNTFIDEVGRAVSEGIKAGQSIGSPAQNFINSLSANFLGLFPRAGAGIVSVVSGDAANDVAVALRGIAKIASDSSDALMPDFAFEANKWMGKISEAQGPGAKLGAAWQWASDSPTSFGSLAWTAGKELSEDMISFALMGKALNTIGTAPGVALGSALTDFALNYGGVTEENISQLINQGLSSEQAASLAGQGAMPAAIAETIVGGIAALVPSAKTAIKDLISLPYKATVDGVEEAASYVFNQKGLGQSIDLNDFWTSGVIAATVGGAGHGGASLSVFLSPQGQGQVIKDAGDLGLSISQDPFLIPESARATITSVINNTAVVSGPNGQTYVADLGKQNILPGQQVNIYSLDTTPVQITPQEMTDYLGLVDGVYQNQLGREPTADEIKTAIKDLSGVGQLQEQLNETQEGQRYDQIIEVFDKTLGRKPTPTEVKANIQRLSNNEITAEQLAIELRGTNEGVLFQQKTDFNAQTDQQIAANAKLLLDQGRTTYADFKNFMDSMGLASDRQLNVLDAITPRTNMPGTVTSIVGNNAIVTGNDGQMYTMLRVAPNNYLMQVGDQVKLGVSTVKPTATPTVEVTTKIADVIAASVSTSTSLSISQSISQAAISTSISNSQSVSTSLSQSESISVSAATSISESVSQSVSLSQSVSKADMERAISISNSVSQSLSVSQAISLSASISEATSLSVSNSQSVSTSISQATSVSEALSLSVSISEQIEKDRLKGLSISASVSESVSKAVSVSESVSVATSISESTSASISNSQSVSVAASISESVSFSTSQSTSVSQALSTQASISEAVSISVAASTSQSISVSQEVSKQVSISQSTSQSVALSQSVSQDQAVSLAASISQSTSQSISEALSISEEAQAMLNASISQSQSISQEISANVIRGMSISASVSEALSISQSISELIEASISVSLSQAATISVTEAISISETVAPTLSITQSQSIEPSVVPTVAPTISATQQITQTESFTQTPSLTMVITTTSLPPVTTTEVATTEPLTTVIETTITVPPVTPPPTSGTIPPVTPPITTQTISIAETTSPPATTTSPPPTTTARPAVTTTRPTSVPFPLFGLPAVGSVQQKTYVDYAQPKVPAPEFGPYDLFKAPSYLRPLQDSGNFGLAALIGAASESQQRNGDNQSQQNAQGQGQTPTG